MIAPPRRSRLVSPLLSVLTFAAAFAWTEAGAAALDSPVQDQGGLFKSDERERLVAELERLRADKDIWFVVHTIDSLKGATVEEYAERYFKQFAIGQAGKDNGLLLVLALKERKSRLEVGYGLEATITDARSNELLVDVLQPRLREGRALEGVMEVITSLRGEAAVEEEAAPAYVPPPLTEEELAEQQRRLEEDEFVARTPIPFWLGLAFAGAWAAIFVGFILQGHQRQRALLPELLTVRADELLRALGNLRFFVVLFSFLTPVTLYLIFFAGLTAAPDAPFIVGGAIFPAFIVSSLVLSFALSFARGLDHVAFLLSVRFFGQRLFGKDTDVHRRFSTKYDQLYGRRATTFGGTSSSSSSSSRSSFSSSSSRSSFSGGGRSGGGGASSGW